MWGTDLTTVVTGGGLALHDPVPDAKTIWLFREQLTRAGLLGGCSSSSMRSCASAATWRWAGRSSMRR
jgi:hypothetical protein